MQKSHPICFLYFTKPQKISFVDIGSESRYTNNMPTYVHFSGNIKLMKEL